MASKNGFQRVREQGRLSGLLNMLSKENGKWMNTRMWLIQSAVWFLLLNGLHGMILYLGGQDSSIPMGGSYGSLIVFFALMGAMTPIGVMILVQGAIVEEKKSGTAEWVLSAPLSREAFILAKLIVNMFWIFGILLLLQGIAYEIVLIGFKIPIIPLSALLRGILVHGYHLLFWLTLSLMLGTFFKGRGAVIGIPFLLLGFQDLIAELGRIYIPGIELWLPKRIEEIATQVAIGEPVSSTFPLLAIGLQIILFTALAFWRFNREEF